MFRNILVAIDGSVHGTRALTEAIDLARQDNGKLTVMTSIPDPSALLLSGFGYGGGGGINYEELMAETQREYQTLLDDAVETVPQDVSVTKVLAHGRPADKIIEQAKAGRHDVIVMGSRGRGEVRSMLLGSVSHEVLNASPAAVLIVHGEEG